jgi:hypothetical protein
MAPMRTEIRSVARVPNVCVLMARPPVLGQRQHVRNKRRIEIHQ